MTAIAVATSAWAEGETENGVVWLLRGGDLSEWEYHSFDDIHPTDYEVRADDFLETDVVFADSAQGASGYIRKIGITAEDSPWLHFQWRVDAAGGDFDERQKSGDDFAFRIYFAARDGLRYKSLSLVRAQDRRGAAWQSPYGGWVNDLRIYAAIGGDEPLGEWHTVSLHLPDLWQELFDAPPPELGLVGLMTDGDSAGVQMRARYGAIALSNSKEPPF